jgi:hypothetical protein
MTENQKIMAAGKYHGRKEIMAKRTYYGKKRNHEEKNRLKKNPPDLKWMANAVHYEQWR